MSEKRDHAAELMDILAGRREFVPPHEATARRLVELAGGEVSGDADSLPYLINALGVTAEINSILEEAGNSPAVARAVTHLLQYPDGIEHRSLLLRYALIDKLLDEHTENAHWIEKSGCERYMIAAVDLLKQRGAPPEHGWPGTAPLLIRGLPIALMLAAIMVRAGLDEDTSTPELHLRLERHASLVLVAEDHPEHAYRLAEFVIARGHDPAVARAFIEEDIPMPLADGFL